jgi:hypothetical protein
MVYCSRRTIVFAVTHGISYEGTTVIAVCDDINIAISIAKDEESKLHKWSTDSIKVVSFAVNKRYESGIDRDWTDDAVRTHYGA